MFKSSKRNKDPISPQLVNRHKVLSLQIGQRRRQRGRKASLKQLPLGDRGEGGSADTEHCEEDQINEYKKDSKGLY
jgi:hypothetical protein